MSQGELQAGFEASAAPVRDRVAVTLGSVLGMAALVALGAQVRVPVPWSDVPMTLQVLAVLLAGYLLPRRRAVASIAVYLACGVAGLPVFAAGSGGLLGSTGGYLAGFVVAAWVVATVVRSPQSGFGRLIVAGSLGLLSIFALGLAWRIALAQSLGWFDGRVGLAVSTGVMPFVLKGVVELLLAAGVATRIRALRQGNVRV